MLELQTIHDLHWNCGRPRLLHQGSFHEDAVSMPERSLGGVQHDPSLQTKALGLDWIWLDLSRFGKALGHDILIPIIIRFKSFLLVTI